MFTEMHGGFPTYEEPVGRFRLLRHEELPEAHKAELRIKGIDPDDNWSLVWSFHEREPAETCLAQERAHAAKWQTWKLVDAGPDAPKTITRYVY